MSDLIRQLEDDFAKLELKAAELQSRIDDVTAQLKTKGALPFEEKSRAEKMWFGRAQLARNHMLREVRAVRIEMRKAKARIHEARQPTPSKSATDKIERLVKSSERQQILVRCLRKIVGETAFFQACDEAEDIFLSQRNPHHATNR